MDKYSNFEQLKTFERAEVDYRVRWRIGRSRIAILSIHGGDTRAVRDAIEPFAEIFAEEVPLEPTD